MKARNNKIDSENRVSFNISWPNNINKKPIPVFYKVIITDKLIYYVYIKIAILY